MNKVDRFIKRNKEGLLYGGALGLLSYAMDASYLKYLELTGGQYELIVVVWIFATAGMILDSLIAPKK